MILTSAEIAALQIVENPVKAFERATTYNATVGEIISGGKLVKGKKYRLPRRGIVWVVSSENFHIPNDVTGLATLRTTWTHAGVLALNVGIIDPNWHGPLATALVNFSDMDFIVEKGAQFLRVMFHKHGVSNSKPTGQTRDEYISDMITNSRRTTDNFLNIMALSKDVRDNLYQSPMWVRGLSWTGIAVSAIAIFVAIILSLFPLVYGTTIDYQKHQAASESAEKRIAALEADQAADRELLCDLTKGKPQYSGSPPAKSCP